MPNITVSACPSYYPDPSQDAYSLKGELTLSIGDALPLLMQRVLQHHDITVGLEEVTVNYAALHPVAKNIAEIWIKIKVDEDKCKTARGSIRDNVLQELNMLLRGHTAWPTIDVDIIPIASSGGALNASGEVVHRWG